MAWRSPPAQRQTSPPPSRPRPPTASTASASSPPPSTAGRSRPTGTPGTSPTISIPNATWPRSAGFSIPARPATSSAISATRYSFDQLPFPDTRITHVYSDPADGLANYIEAFPGVRIARTLQELVESVDAVWLGDASGRGHDHFDLVAPGLHRGLPTFCDKPIGGTVAQTRRILELAREHQAPIMSSSIFRHEFGMEHALRMRDSGEFGSLQFVLASMYGGYSPQGWFIYGQHPVWTVMTLCGPGVEAVSMYARQATAHALITYPDRMPAEVWYGRPDLGNQYCQTTVHFERKVHQFTPALEGDFWFGHHYEMFRMAHAFREMIRTRREPIPHNEILEVTAILYAGARSMTERGRLVELREVMG